MGMGWDSETTKSLHPPNSPCALDGRVAGGSDFDFRISSSTNLGFDLIPLSCPFIVVVGVLIFSRDASHVSFFPVRVVVGRRRVCVQGRKMGFMID